MASSRRRSPSPPSSEYAASYNESRRTSLDTRSVASRPQPQRYSTNSSEEEYEHSVADRVSVSSGLTSQAGAPNNVFATPEISVTNSLAASSEDVRNVFDTSTSSLRRHSTSLSLPRSSSPLPPVDGGGRGSGYFPGSNRHQRSFSSLSRATTPSTESGQWSGPTLNRSNTTGTTGSTNSETLYSLPAHYNSRPVSPMHAGGRIQPAFDYGRHQQALSVHSSEMEMEMDPFGDGFVVDGFAPRHSQQARRPGSAVGSEISSLPPPYTEHAGQFVPGKGQSSAEGSGAPGAAPGAATATAAAAAAAAAAATSTVATPSPTQPAPVFDHDLRDATRTAGIGAMAGPPESMIGAHTAGEPGPVQHHPSYQHGPQHNPEDPSGAAKEWQNGKKRFFGPRKLLLIAAGLLALGIGVGLGVGLGIGLRQKETNHHKEYSPPPSHDPLPEETTAPIFDPDDVFPELPTGSHFIGPLHLGDSNHDCEIYTDDPTAPDFFQAGAESLWTCSIPEMKPFLWNIQALPANLTGTQIANLGSDPEPLQCAEFEEGKWGGYTVTSKEGERDKWGDNEWKDKEGNWYMYAGGKAWREGLQSPAFWNEPLTFLNISEEIDGVEQERVRMYKFGLLHEKKVLLRESTLVANHVIPADKPMNHGDDEPITEGEIVWMCSWNKTLFEVDLFVDVEAEVDTVGFDLPAFISSYSDVVFDGVEEITASEEALKAKEEALEAAGEGEQANELEENEHNLEEQEEAAAKESVDHDTETVFDEIEDGDYKPEDDHEGFPGVEDHRANSTTSSNATVSNEVSSLKARSSKKGPHRYPLKIRIREYRPNVRRLKDVQGIDRTEGNFDPRSHYGDIHCVKMVALADHGLRTYVDSNGDGQVTLKQKVTTEEHACLCSWSN